MGNYCFTTLENEKGNKVHKCIKKGLLCNQSWQHSDCAHINLWKFFTALVVLDPWNHCCPSLSSFKVKGLDAQRCCISVLPLRDGGYEALIVFCINLISFLPNLAFLIPPESCTSKYESHHPSYMCQDVNCGKCIFYSWIS